MNNKKNYINGHDKQKMNSKTIGVVFVLILQLFLSNLIISGAFDLKLNIIVQVITASLTIFNIGITQLIIYDKLDEFFVKTYYKQINKQLLKGKHKVFLVSAKIILKCLFNKKSRANFLVLFYLFLKFSFISLFFFDIYLNLNISYYIYLVLLLILIIINIIIHSLGYWSLREEHYLSKAFDYFFDPLPGEKQLYGRFDMLIPLDDDEQTLSGEKEEGYRFFFEYTYYVSLYGCVFEYCFQYFLKWSLINRLLNMLIFNILFISMVIILLINIKYIYGLA